MGANASWLYDHLLGAPADATAVAPRGGSQQDRQNVVKPDTQTALDRWANDPSGSPISRALQALPRDAYNGGKMARAQYDRTAAKGDFLGGAIGAGLAAVPFVVPGGEEAEGLNLLGHEVNPAMRAARAVDGFIPGETMNMAGGAVPISHAVADEPAIEHMRNAHQTLLYGGNKDAALSRIQQAWYKDPAVAQKYVQDHPAIVDMLGDHPALRTQGYADDALGGGAMGPSGPQTAPAPQPRTFEPPPVHPLDNPAIRQPPPKKGLLESFTADSVARKVATGSLRPHLTPAGNPDILNIAEGMQKRTPLPPISEIDKDQARTMAKVYDKLPENDPGARKAYDALNTEVAGQRAALEKAGYKLEFVDHDPYKSSKEMMADVRDNKRLKVFKTPADNFHPYMTPEQNDSFRGVHDLLAHAGPGNQFGPKGEEMAYRLHHSTLSDEAVPALAAETRGQNSWVNFGPNELLAPKDRPFAKQKAALWPVEYTGDYNQMPPITSLLRH